MHNDRSMPHPLNVVETADETDILGAERAIFGRVQAALAVERQRKRGQLGSRRR